MIATYHEAMDYLYSFVNFEHKNLDQYSSDKISLDRPARLLNILGNPHEQYPAIHIAGTKGKGSVAAMCATSLRSAGLSVGLYTSPHLQGFRDRIRVLSDDGGDGRINQDEVVSLTNLLQDAAESVMNLTWYELITAMAFVHFSRRKVDAAVIEVGLGGRLDATNVITPVVSVITSLSLDHTYLLGDTLAEIAAEKAGIIKTGVPVVTAPQDPAAMQQLVDIANSKEAPLTAVGQEWEFEKEQIPVQEAKGPYKWERQVTLSKAPADSGLTLPAKFDLALAGRHQQENATVALATLHTVHGHFPSLTWDAIRSGFTNVNWPGRFQMLQAAGGRAPIMLDCAHNVHSAGKVRRALAEDFSFQRLWLIIGISNDKDLEGILKELLPVSDKVILTASSHPRAADPRELQYIARELGFEPEVAESVSEAIKVVWPLSRPRDLICVTGSIFVVADLLNERDVLQSDLETLTQNQRFPWRAVD